MERGGGSDVGVAAALRSRHCEGGFPEAIQPLAAASPVWIASSQAPRNDGLPDITMPLAADIRCVFYIFEMPIPYVVPSKQLYLKK